MAIIADVPTERTIFPQQYIRVHRVDVRKTEMVVDVAIFLNQSVTDNPPHRIEHVMGPFDLHSSKNLWEQAYALMKNRWPDGVDC